jgi:hypothetical protein
MPAFVVVEVDNDGFQVYDSGGVLIDPAKDASVLAITTALNAIKNTDGIKKIVDPLPAGTNNIGDVDLASAIPAGDNNIGNVDLASSIPAGDNNIGNVDLASAIPAGDNNIGNVDLASPIPAGTNNIGDVDIASAIPAGTNEIGKVAQGTKAAGSGAWPLVLYDASGNPVGVVHDNSIYRVETRSTLVGQKNGTGSEYKVTTIQDAQDSTEQRLQTESRLAPGSVVNIGTGVPANPGDLVISFLLNSASPNMLVDGGTSPVVFSYYPPTGKIVSIQEVLLVFTADDFEFDGASFGPNAKLTNGIKFETIIDGVTTDIFDIYQNEDFLRVPGRIPLVNNTGPKDVLACSFQFGGLLKLIQTDGDYLKITVQDNLTSIKLKYLTATLFGSTVS